MDIVGTLPKDERFTLVGVSEEGYLYSPLELGNDNTVIFGSIYTETPMLFSFTDGHFVTQYNEESRELYVRNSILTVSTKPHSEKPYGLILQPYNAKVGESDVYLGEKYSLVDRNIKAVIICNCYTKYQDLSPNRNELVDGTSSLSAALAGVSPSGKKELKVLSFYVAPEKGVSMYTRNACVSVPPLESYRHIIRHLLGGMTGYLVGSPLDNETCAQIGNMKVVYGECDKDSFGKCSGKDRCAFSKEGYYCTGGTDKILQETASDEKKVHHKVTNSSLGSAADVDNISCTSTKRATGSTFKVCIEKDKGFCTTETDKAGVVVSNYCSTTDDGNNHRDWRIAAAIISGVFSIIGTLIFVVVLYFFARFLYHLGTEQLTVREKNIMTATGPSDLVKGKKATRSKKTKNPKD